MKQPPILNENGYSVKGCSYLYAPKGQALEYSKLSTNPYRGCGHACAYCYVPLVLKMKRTDFDAISVPRKSFLQKLENDCKKYKELNVTGEQVMLSFTTDVYNPFNTSITRAALSILQNYGFGICVLTKGGKRALADIDLYRPDRDAFASTLTSLDAKFSLKWERGAALPEDRIWTLREFHNRGIFTWVSLEPTLDADSSVQIIEATYKFVDLYKIGKANYIPQSKSIDWRSYTERMLLLVQMLGVKYYFKKDLQPYLPENLYNPMHINQFH